MVQTLERAGPSTAQMLRTDDFTNQVQVEEVYAEPNGLPPDDAIAAAFALVREEVMEEATRAGVVLARAAILADAGAEKAMRDRLAAMRAYLGDTDALLTRWHRIMEGEVKPVRPSTYKKRTAAHPPDSHSSTDLDNRTTPAYVFENALLFALHALGGTATMADARQYIESAKLLDLTPTDQQVTSAPGGQQRRWHMMLARAIGVLSEAACVVKEGKSWALTLKGRDRLEAQTDDTHRREEANGHAVLSGP